MGWGANELCDDPYKRVWLNPEIFKSLPMYRRIFERLGDLHAGKAVARVVQRRAAFDEPLMQKLVEFWAKHIMGLNQRYAPSLNGN